ncbi:MAG: hypothetical protein E7228_07530 [Clostridiales bacterium]|nr:hypothetical protein [Clostridiales bacterium]
MSEKLAPSKIGYILAIASAFFYALQVVVGKLILQEGIAARDLLVVQYSGATILLFLFLIIRHKQTGVKVKMDRKFLKSIIIQGSLGCCLTTFFFYLAMERVSAGICSMLLYLCPVYVCIFFMITGIRKITFFNKLSVVLAFVGAVFVLNIFALEEMKWSGLGLALGCISGICYAFYGVHADLKLKDMPVEQMLFYMYLVGTITFWVLNPGFISDPLVVEGGRMQFLVFCVIILQVLPMALLNLAIRAIGSNKATVIATAELPITIVLAYIFLKEQMVAVQLFGILLIVAAIVIIQVKKE